MQTVPQNARARTSADSPAPKTPPTLENTLGCLEEAHENLVKVLGAATLAIADLEAHGQTTFLDGYVSDMREAAATVGAGITAAICDIKDGRVVPACGRWGGDS